jgi:hypothetical protein
MAVGCILLAASGPASAYVGTIVTCMHGEQPGYTRRLPKTPLQLPRRKHVWQLPGQLHASQAEVLYGPDHQQPLTMTT